MYSKGLNSIKFNLCAVAAVAYMYGINSAAMLRLIRTTVNSILTDAPNSGLTRTCTQTTIDQYFSQF